jgi:hypothetical protein
MKKNMGTMDRGARALIAVAIAGLWLAGAISGALAIALGIVAVAFFATSLIGWCPLYVPLGISTRKLPGAMV